MDVGNATLAENDQEALDFKVNIYVFIVAKAVSIQLHLLITFCTCKKFA